MTAWELLAAPFDASEIEWRETGGSTAPYPRPDAIMNRLDAVVGPENWTFELAVVSADPRPVYICKLGVRADADAPWVWRAATSGEPSMGGKRGPDFLNSGKGGGTYAFRKAFQDGFCRYLSDPSRWPKRHPSAQAGGFDEVPIPPSPKRPPSPQWAEATATVAGQAAAAHGKGTDWNGFEPMNPDRPACPKCRGQMWDNREPERGGKGQFPKSKPTAPDFKCRDKNCDGKFWPSKGPKMAEKRIASQPEPDSEDFWPDASDG